MDLPLTAKSQSSLTDFTTERSAISGEIDDYLRKILALKTRLNIFTHINQLPTEILAQILVAYTRDHYRLATGHGNTSGFSAKPGWIKLAHVCRHWRDVALGTPRFWSHVYVQQPKTFCDLLPLSKSSPLYIDLTLEPSVWIDFGAWNSATELIGQQSHRLRELRYVATLKQIRMLAEKLSHPMRLLEKLVLSRCTSKDPDPDGSVPLHLLPATGHTPRLFHLEIHQLPVAWTDPVFCPTLTTLVVVGPKAARDPVPPTGTFEQFLDALQAMAPSLVHLTLDGCVPRFQTAASEPPPPTRSIALPSLQRLKIDSATNNCAFLMEHLLVNPAALLTVTALGVAGIPRLVEILSAHVSRTTPLLVLHILCPDYSSSSVNIVAQRGVTDLGFSVRAPLDLTLRTTHLDEALDRPLTAVLKASKTLFSCVRTLHISSYDELDVNWQRLFARMTSVEILDISGHPGKGFSKALCDVRRKKKGESPRWDVPLRRLRELRLNDVRFHQSPMIPVWVDERSSRADFTDHLLDWAILRCNYGLPLERLELSECKHATAKDVNRLKEVVVEVKWDGWERDSTDEDDDDYDDETYDDDEYPYPF